MATAVLLIPTTAQAAPEPAPSPTPGSAAYIIRDDQNIEAAFGRPINQVETPGYLEKFFFGALSLWISGLVTQAQNPTRPSLTLGSLAPGDAMGNPDRANWSGTRGQEIPVTFTGADGAELAGDVFAPLPGARDPYTGAVLHGPYPGAVIITGSVQADRDDYDWVAEDLAERGYVTMTFDVQGQGGSESLPHNGPDPNLPYCDLTAPDSPGQITPCDGVPDETNQNFIDSTEKAISFFLSTPSAPYPNVGAGSLAVNPYNPLWDLFDHSPDLHTVTPGRTTRLALIGHSTGAVIASYLQGVDHRIETVVALDKLTATPDAINDDEALTAEFAGLGPLPGPVVPKVPALALQAEYGFEPQPYWEASCSSFEPCPAAPGGTIGAPQLDQAPDPNREEDTGFNIWRRAHIDSMVMVPRASTHLIFSDSPPILPASLYGQDIASYYVQAWLDKYLKHETSANYALLSPTIRYIGPDQSGHWEHYTFDRDDNLSFYFCSGYQFNLPDGKKFADLDITHDGCT